MSKGENNCLPDYLSHHSISYNDELLDSEYGLGFRHDKSSSVQFIDATVTRSKTREPSTNVSSCSLQQRQSSSDLSSSSIIKHFDITQLQEHQNNDIRIQKIVNDFKHNPLISFELNDGILYKLQSSSHGKVKRKLIYVPSSMIKSLLVSYHDNPFIGGHFAIPYNTSRQKRPDFLHPVRPSDGANELLGIDFCGPFTPTFTDNREVLCLNNYYTNFVTAIPLPTCLAQVTAEAIFKEHICRFGVPKATISDQEHNTWDEYLYPIVLAYNTGMHATTNFTAFELTFGRPASFPTDRLPTTITFSHSHDYLDQLVRNLKYYYTTVRQRIKQHAQSKNSI
ncbi:unnamed protein product [Rotaria socialis]